MGTLRLLPRASHPTVTHDARQGGDDPFDTGPDHTLISSSLQSVSSLTACDVSRRTVAFHMRTPTWCRRQAAEIGPAATAVIGELLAENALFRLRAAQGVLGLADKHDPARLEAACAKATAAGDPSYRTIKGILAAGTETTPAARPSGDAGAPAHLHGPAQ